ARARRPMRLAPAAPGPARARRPPPPSTRRARRGRGGGPRPRRRGGGAPAGEGGVGDQGLRPPAVGGPRARAGVDAWHSHHIFSMLTRNALNSGVRALASPTNGVRALASRWWR